MSRLALPLFLLLAALTALWTPSLPASSRHPLASKIKIAANRWSLDPLFVEAVVTKESNSRATAVSGKGAMGLMQVMPGTADQIEIHDPFNPLDNLMGACEYLRLLMNQYQRRLPLVLAAYNAGPGNVAKYKGIPPFRETQEYVRSVLALYEKLKKENQ